MANFSFYGFTLFPAGFVPSFDLFPIGQLEPPPFSQNLPQGGDNCASGFGEVPLLGAVFSVERRCALF